MLVLLVRFIVDAVKFMVGAKEIHRNGWEIAWSSTSSANRWALNEQHCPMELGSRLRVHRRQCGCRGTGGGPTA